MITINVTQKDIDNGVAISVGWCPIAQATKRKLRRKYVSVGAITLSVCDRWERMERSGRLPKSAQLFIADFDNGRAVKPFQFQIELA